MTDRRRVNGPSGGTAPPRFISGAQSRDTTLPQRPRRTRQDSEMRKIFLKTGLTPSASGSAYLEIQPTTPLEDPKLSLVPVASAPKITCVVHGPRPLPRSAPFTPYILLSTHVKFAPFAARQRRGYIRDSSERDLAVHLETALRGVIIGDRWPKSGVEVIITILEGEEDRWWADETKGGSTGPGSIGGWGIMSLLAGCITVASAAIADAGIDCVDLVCGGVAALLKPESGKSEDGRDRPESTHNIESRDTRLILDPCPSEHANIQAVCALGYMSSREEITEIWIKGDLQGNSKSVQHSTFSKLPLEDLLDGAINAALGVQSVLAEVVREAGTLKIQGETCAALVAGKDPRSVPEMSMDMKD